MSKTFSNQADNEFLNMSSKVCFVCLRLCLLMRRMLLVIGDIIAYNLVNNIPGAYKLLGLFSNKTFIQKLPGTNQFPVGLQHFWTTGYVAINLLIIVYT